MDQLVVNSLTTWTSV